MVLGIIFERETRRFKDIQIVEVFEINGEKYTKAMNR